MKRVLVISHPFPPAGGGGVQRTVKLVKYLPEFGWEPEVLTIRRPTGGPTDHTLLSEIPPQVRVHRTWTPEPKAEVLRRLPRVVQGLLHYGLLIPDPSLLWVPFALRQALRLHREHPFDAVYVTGNPFSSYLVGIWFKRLTGRPLITDVRDYWHLNPYRPRGRRAVWRNCIEGRMERRTIQAADAVMVVSETMAADYRVAYPGAAARIHVVYNGADAADFPPAADADHDRLLPQDTLNIVHAGAFTDNRRPEPVLAALDLFRSEYPDRRVHLWLVGAADGRAQQFVEKLGLQDWVTFTGYVDHAAAIRYMREASLLLLVVGTDPRSRGFLTGKLFEYLLVGRPILAIVPPDSEPLRLIEGQQVGRTVTTQDPEAIRDLLRELSDQGLQGNRQPIQLAGAMFTRRAAAEVVASLLRNVTGDDLA